MAVSVNIVGHDQPFRATSLEDYSIVEDATPMDPNSMLGGYGQINFNILTYPGYRLLRGKRFELIDNVKGKTSGTVTSLAANNYNVAVTTDSALGVLNAWQSVSAYTGTFEGLIQHWFSVVGLDLAVRFESDIASRSITTPGFVGNMWDHMKWLLSANRIEMALVFNTVVFREFREFVAVTDRLSNVTVNVGQGESARSIEISYYNNRYVVGEELYPLPSSYDASEDDDDVNAPVIMQADANETVEYTLQLEATPIAIDENPTPVSSVTNSPQGSSKYVVVGADDLPIQPGQWTDAGGKLTAKISEDDPTQLIVTFRGANIPSLAPFRVAMSSGSGNYYNSLHILGTGTVFEKKTIQIYTGAATDTTGTDIGVSVENPFVNTLSDAIDLGMRTAAAYSGFEATIGGEAVNINRRGIDEGIRALIRDFNDSW